MYCAQDHEYEPYSTPGPGEKHLVFFGLFIPQACKALGVLCESESVCVGVCVCICVPVKLGFQSPLKTSDYNQTGKLCSRGSII